MFSTPVKGTHPNKIKMNWWEYWIGHAWMTGWQTMSRTFRMWCHLMSSRYDGYALMREDDPEAECIEWFWASLNEDDVYPKEFLEELMQMVDDLETGKEEFIPLDENLFERMKSLIEGDETDENDN